jgi:endonuclease-3
MPAPLTYAETRELYARLRAARPDPKPELEHRNAFTLLVAVVLSAQATDKGVNRATRGLFAEADTPQALLDLGEERLLEHIRTIGLYKQKAKNVLKLARILVEAHGGEVPSSRAALAALPGVGRKTANVVLNVWWRQPAMAVDTHVFRVANRTGLAPGRDVIAVERALEDVTPADFALEAHHQLILHGRYVCVARRPRCPDCPIVSICRFEEKTPA